MTPLLLRYCPFLYPIRTRFAVSKFYVGGPQVELEKRTVFLPFLPLVSIVSIEIKKIYVHTVWVGIQSFHLLYKPAIRYLCQNALRVCFRRQPFSGMIRIAHRKSSLWQDCWCQVGTIPDADAQQSSGIMLCTSISAVYTTGWICPESCIRFWLNQQQDHIVATTSKITIGTLLFPANLQLVAHPLILPYPRSILKRVRQNVYESDLNSSTTL